MNTKPQILFLSHGGGPMPLLGDVGHKEMIDCLQKISSILRKPSAILVVSAHWEEKSQPLLRAPTLPLFTITMDFQKSLIVLPILVRESHHWRSRPISGWSIQVFPQNLMSSAVLTTVYLFL